MALEPGQLADAIRAYPAHYGQAWAIFWDYKCGVETAGHSIAEPQHRWQTALQLMAYLCCFGMGRASTRLTDITVDGLADVLARIKPETYAALRAARFERLDDDYGRALVAVWEQLTAALKHHDVSSTDTMVTKMLMGLWGGCPACASSSRDAPRSRMLTTATSSELTVVQPRRNSADSSGRGT